MIVELYDRSRLRVEAPPMVPLRYNANAIGGPANAMIQVNGSGIDLLRYIGYYVVIRNANNTPVWWGTVEEVLTSIDALQVGTSQRELRNRIKVLFSYLDGEGIPTPAETDWAQHDRSVGVYGRFEERHSLGQANLSQAVSARNRAITAFGLPKPSLRISKARNGAVLRCVGLWDTLDQTYFINEVGRELYTAEHDVEQVMGWAKSSNSIGFTDRSIQNIDGGFEVFEEGDKFTVSGSQHNDGVWTVFETAEGKPRNYTNNTIAFDPSDDINDSGEGLGFVKAGQFILVGGSPQFSGWHLTDEVSRVHIATVEEVTGNITTENAGPFISITQGQRMALTSDVDVEVPGNQITVTAHGVRVAYSFTISDSEGWSPGELWVKLRRNGSTADNVKIELCATSSNTVGAVLDSATVPGSSLLQRMAWVKFDLNHNVTLAPGGRYWIVISRTGNNDQGAYYTVGLDETVGHNGTLLLWTGSGWTSRGKPASMPFQVWGHTRTTTQIRNILVNEGQYFLGISVRPESNVWRQQYRDGVQRAIDELNDLLGDYLPTVTPDWHVIVDNPPPKAPRYQLRRDGILTTIDGQPVETGLLPVGQWCTVDGIPELDSIAPISPFLIGFLEYNAERGELLDIRAIDGTDVWALGVRQG